MLPEHSFGVCVSLLTATAHLGKMLDFSSLLGVVITYLAFSALTQLVGRQEEHVKNSAVECWRDYLAGARCRLAYGPADATATHCLLLQ